MQAGLDNSEELYDGRGELPDDDIDAIDGIDPQTDDYPEEDIGEPFEYVRAAVTRATVHISDALRALWSRLMPYEAESEDSFADGDIDEPPDVGETSADTGDDIIDDTDEHIIELPDETPSEPDDTSSGEVPAKYDRLLSGKKRRRVSIHSPAARRPERAISQPPLFIATPDNELSWDRARGVLTVTEPILEEADPLEPSGSRDARRKRSATLDIRMLDERIIPVFLGVINAIGLDGDEAEPSAADLPYVCESGPNTFCWYRAARLLRIYGQKRVDDKGLLHSSKCVELHAQSLPPQAKGLFTEILAMRSSGDPYRGMI
ncbi:MAG: hypothetical protein LBH66_09185 [Oscillospiraceae bacterium]|nr:hypothetical protein [Oscillospiraceae bacterium]